MTFVCRCIEALGVNEKWAALASAHILCSEMNLDCEVALSSEKQVECFIPASNATQNSHKASIATKQGISTGQDEV